MGCCCLQTAKDCWRHEPSERPTFEEVVELLRREMERGGSFGGAE